MSESVFKRAVAAFQHLQRLGIDDGIRFVSATEEDYEEALGAVPPQCYGRRGFLLGEPWSDNRQGEQLWFAFLSFPLGGHVCALMTEKQFRDNFASDTVQAEELIEEGVPDDIRAFSLIFCKTFGVRGLCDPMYICNVTAFELGRGDGHGNFGDGMGEGVGREKTQSLNVIADRFASSYSTCIKKTGIHPARIRGLCDLFSRKVRPLSCCCCGARCSGRQWWNRDDGFGLCPGCVEFCQRGEDLAGMVDCYGFRGVHYDLKGESVNASL